MPTVTPDVGALAAAGLAPAPLITLPTVTLSEVQYAAVAATALGDNTLVDAVAGRAIRVTHLVLVASGGANTAEIQAGAGGRTLWPAADLANDGQLVLAHNPAGWCETYPGELLNLSLSDATAVAGLIGYVLF